MIKFPIKIEEMRKREFECEFINIEKKENKKNGKINRISVSSSC